MKSFIGIVRGVIVLAITLCLARTAMGGPAFITNTVVAANTSQGSTVTFNLAGGTNFVWYGVYQATNLSSPQWVWLTNAYTGNQLTFTNQAWPSSYYALFPAAPTTVVAWGDNNSGQCNVPVGLTNAIAVSGGFNFSVALKADGKVVAWGDNTYGQTNVPIGVSNIVAIAAGGAHVLALRQNGTVVAWGYDNYGQTNVPAGLTNVTAIAAGNSCCMALLKNQTITAWGYDAYGQTSIPALGPVTQVAAGTVQGVALLTNSTVPVWSNADIPFAPYYWFFTNEPAGITNVVAIAAGSFHTVTLLADGQVLDWGAGQFDTGNYYNDGQCLVTPGLANVVAIGAGDLYSVALEANGTFLAWGDNTYGELNVPVGLTGVKMMSAGGYHGLVLCYPR